MNYHNFSFWIPKALLVFYSVPIEDGVFNFKLPEIYQDYSYQAMVNSKHFWEAWKIVTTNTDTIFVTDRPKFEKSLNKTL